MTPRKPLVALLGMVLLAGCASAKTKPTVLQSLPSEIKLPVRVSSVTVDAAEGIWVSDEDRMLVQQKIRSRLDALPVTDATMQGPVYAMRVLFTRFDHGSSAARLGMIGLGQIHMNGTVSLVDQTGKLCGEYKIGKGLVLGGIAGGLTSTSDVEDGFAKSVVAILTPKAETPPGRKK
ncbi:MAG: DUF4410 domain-containing protein [Novosphingobium sp.]